MYNCIKLEVIKVTENIYKRLARVEAMANAQHSEMLETLKNAYAAACESENAEDAAAIVRKIRNKLLESSDKEMTLDRLGLDTTSVTRFIASLTSIFNGEWAKYRKALRDLPQQEGFPFNVVFPTVPGSGEANQIQEDAQ